MASFKPSSQRGKVRPRCRLTHKVMRQAQQQNLLKWVTHQRNNPVNVKEPFLAKTSAIYRLVF